MRNFLSTAIIILFTLIGVQVAHGQAQKESKQQLSPHSVALMLVLEQKKDEIAKLDNEKLGNEDNMLDIKERSWIVIRPFSPGIVDSTHMFIVTYRIDNHVIKSWNVDIRDRTVN